MIGLILIFHHESILTIDKNALFLVKELVDQTKILKGQGKGIIKIWAL